MFQTNFFFRLQNGTESSMDLWILSRLAGTIESCNNGFEIYDFTVPTGTFYSFWLYDLCDVYLECLKPIFQSGTEAAKSSARQTLFTCLYSGLKLISPFMPFITEELFQRLPRADTNVLSICVSEYPGRSKTRRSRSVIHCLSSNVFHSRIVKFTMEK